MPLYHVLGLEFSPLDIRGEKYVSKNASNNCSFFTLTSRLSRTKLKRKQA